MTTHPRRSTEGARRLRLIGVLSIIASLFFGLSATTASAAAPGFGKEAGKNTYATETTLSANCPEGIAGTPGSDPADKALAAGNTAASFQPGGTIHYVYHDNPNDDSENFNLEDCVVSYPADKFQASDFNADGQLINALKKNVLVDDATELDKATLTGVTASTGDIFYTWTSPADIDPGVWVCNFARDTSTGHGGGGNRKVSPTCFQVEGPITATDVTLDLGNDCDELDSFTITATPNVTYKVDGVTTAAGTYAIAAGDTVEVTAHTVAPYVLTGTTSWGPWTGSTPTPCATDVVPDPVADPVRECGVADRYTIPAVNDVEYRVNGVAKAAGTYDLAEGEIVDITAHAINGRTMDPGATTSWGPFTGQAIVPCAITPDSPSHTVDTDCGDVDTYTIPSQTGVQYKVNGADKAAGTYDLPAGETITITAHEVAPYTFVRGATTSWGPSTGSEVETCRSSGGGGGSTDDVTPANARVVRECGETDQYVVPSRSGVFYRVDGDIAEAGSYDLPEGETVTITAHATSGNRIPSSATSRWSFTGEASEPCPTTTTTTEPVLAFTPDPPQAQVETPAPPAPAPVLAFTGWNTMTTLLVAFALLVIGTICLAVSKRELRVK